LLERALDPKERHKLGAHYTPRAYVERLVIPTVVEPLREDWENVKIAAVALAGQGKLEEACEEVEAFHRQLCQTRVLDPACGSGNFLYVTMEHMKRLEGEVLDTLNELGQGLSLFQAAEVKGFSVTPEQFLGIEANPMAAAVARVVLWIGYLQWHFRTRGKTMPPEPVLKTSDNIECRDAVLTWDGDPEPVLDEEGNPVTRWDGESMKPHPVTGKLVPDETMLVPLYRYLHPTKAEWPSADFVVGNPPFLGNWRMRTALGDGYTEALRGTYSKVPESVDYVTYWWNNAAQLARRKQIRRFGLITTNSLPQKFGRQVLGYHMGAEEPLSLVFAVPDHPWIDAADGAAVRITMTVGEAGKTPGRLLLVRSETTTGDGAREVLFDERTGSIHPDLKTGANVSSARALLANAQLCCPGVKLHGAGFIVTPEEAESLGLGRVPGLEQHIRPYRNGRDVLAKSRGVMVIDLLGLTVEELRHCYPEVFQWVHERVRPERIHNRRRSYADNWWVFGEPRKEFRPALDGLERYVSTVETSKHRVFVFLDEGILPDNMLVCVALDDSFHLGVLSSRIHVTWALSAGGSLEDRPRYNKTRCFDPFPFPDCSEERKAQVREFGEALDGHRKRQQGLHPGLTLTNMYNVVAKLRTGEPLTASQRKVHEQGLCSLLKQIHDDLDAAVFEAYGWPPTLTDDEILERLVELNHERAAEEKEGLVRWLRPEFQAPDADVVTAEVPGKELSREPELLEAPKAAVAAAPSGPPMPTTKKTKRPRQPWPSTVPAQVQAVRSALLDEQSPVTPQVLARRFEGRKAPKIQEILETLVMLGQARRVEGGYGV
jgi:hypothetical protein